MTCPNCSAGYWSIISYITHQCDKLEIEPSPELVNEIQVVGDCFLAAITEWLVTYKLGGIDGYTFDIAMGKMLADPPYNFMAKIGKGDSDEN